MGLSRRTLLGLMLAGLCGVSFVVHAQTPVVFEKSRLSLTTDRGRFEFTVEMAVTWEQRRQGLMFRRELAPDAGMLFDYGTVAPVAMWMKNTLIPLDMIFIGADGQVVNIGRNTTPQSLKPVRSWGPVRAVLEVRAGTASRLGLKAGDAVRHPLFKNAR